MQAPAPIRRLEPSKRPPALRGCERVPGVPEDRRTAEGPGDHAARPAGPAGRPANTHEFARDVAHDVPAQAVRKVRRAFGISLDSEGIPTGTSRRLLLTGGLGGTRSGELDRLDPKSWVWWRLETNGDEAVPSSGAPAGGAGAAETSATSGHQRRTRPGQLQQAPAAAGRGFTDRATRRARHVSAQASRTDSANGSETPAPGQPGRDHAIN